MPKSRAKNSTENMVTRTLTEIPEKTALQFFFSVSSCRYRGTARQMVAGVSR